MTPFLNYIVHCSLTLLLVSSCSLPASSDAVSDGDSARLAPPDTLLELPAYGKDEHILYYEGFIVSYNHTTLVPNWVAYELTAEELEVKYDNPSSNFSRDPQLKGRQASREDYSHSGWDKGHMAPKADMRWSKDAYWQSHYFPNICPQDHQLNGGDWNTLEKSVRRWAKQYGRVWVVCGPIFDSCRYGTIGDAGVQVPDAFFKAVLVPRAKGYSGVAFVMPNEGRHHSMKHYACTIDQLEERLHRDLFPALDDAVEAEVESEAVMP